MVRQDISDSLEANLQETMDILQALNLTGGNHALQAVNLLDEDHVPGQQVQVRDDQVRNNAGGFVFKVSDTTRIRRFLILGTEGGTYYVQEKELSVENVEALVRMLDEGKAGLLLREVVEISLAGRAPKQEPTLLALALLCHYRPSWLPKAEEVRKLRDSKDKREQEEYKQKMSLIRRHEQLKHAAFAAVPRVCRIPTHLFAFVKFSKTLSKEFNGSAGWGRGMRDAVRRWYTSKAPKELAMHVTKYPQRGGYSHRDLLRLAHPHAGEARCHEETLVYDQVFHFACTGQLSAEKRQLPDEPPLKRDRCDYEVTPEMVAVENGSEAIQLLNAVLEMKALKPEGGERRCAELIRQRGLVREHVPTDLLNSTMVWAALLEKMPMTALIRNLSKLSTIGLISGANEANDAYVSQVVAKLTDEAAIQKARIHPVSVLLAAATYTQGRGFRGGLVWRVNPQVEKALDAAFLKAFKNVEPTGKRFCLGIDVSGSMSSPVGGGSGVLSCRQASVAMSKVFLETEPLVECMAFQDQFVPLPFKKGSNLKEMVDYTARLPFGSTDCATPMLWALENRKKFDVFVVFTDCETWCGAVHPFQALQDYRREMDIPDARLVVMGMTSTDFTIADPTDPGMLDVCGFDSAVPELVRSFVLGQI